MSPAVPLAVGTAVHTLSIRVAALKVAPRISSKHRDAPAIVFLQRERRGRGVGGGGGGHILSV